MRKSVLLFLWSALIALFLGLVPAQAQTNCLVPATAGATPVASSVQEGSHVLKSAPGCLLAAYVTTSVSGYLMLFNSTTIPVDGTVTPIECISANIGTTFVNFAPLPPEYYSVGISAVFSTTGCFTKTISSTAFFHALVQ